jgi:hypothetical protein
MANNSEEEKEGQQKPRIYLFNLDGCNHTRIVNAQYLRDTVHKLAGGSFCICQSKLASDYYKDGQHTFSHPAGKNPTTKRSILVSSWSLFESKRTEGELINGLCD